MKNKSILTILALASSLSAMAQEEINPVVDQTFENPPMNIEGEFDKKKQEAPVEVQVAPVVKKAPAKAVSQSERIRQMRMMMEKRTEQQMKKKVEQLRLKQELEIARRMEQAFNDEMRRIDNIK